jgi:hypothetical protein
MPFSQSGARSRNEPSFTDPETILPQDITGFNSIEPTSSFQDHLQRPNVNFQPKLNILLYERGLNIFPLVPCRRNRSTSNPIKPAHNAEKFSKTPSRAPVT